jgi:DNA-binding PadR family transcriptional regulator
MYTISGNRLIEKNSLTKDMKKVMMKVKVLKVIGANRMYSYAIINEIASSPSLAQFFSCREAIKDEVYNTINILEKAGYIRLARQSTTGRIVKYYEITKDGKSVLNGAKKVYTASIKEISNMFK